MLALAPSTLVTLAVASGATTPVPTGGAGSLIWSSTTGAPLVRNGSQWTACATGSGSGDVTGPASATDNAVVRFDATTGKLVQASDVTIDDAGRIGVGSILTQGAGWAGITLGGGGKSGEFYLCDSSGNVIGQLLANGSNPNFGVKLSGDSVLDCYLAAWSGGNQLMSKSRDLEINVGSSFPTRIKVLAASGKVQVGSSPPSNGLVNVDGTIRAFTNSGANEAAAPLANWVMLTADYTLTSTTSAQKAFNTSTNGTLTLPSGVYHFEAFLYLTTMSGTSGNFAFNPIGSGTATVDRVGYAAHGIDNTTPLNAGTQTGSASVTAASAASVVTAGTGTGAVASIRGMFRVSAGGTIIPSVSLVTAAAAVMKAGSYFKIEKIGESSETSLGAWS